MQVFTISGTKIRPQKKRAGREEKGSSPTTAESSLQSQRGPAGRRARGGERTDPQGHRGQRGRGQSTARAFPWPPLLAEPGFLLYLAWTGALRGSRTLWLTASRATQKEKCKPRSILNSHQESPASTERTKVKTKDPPPHRQHLVISAAASPAHDLETHSDAAHPGHSASGGALQGGPCLQMFISEP